jgi:hypothetical protein
MPFTLRDVGLGCFTLVFKGEDIGAVFSTDDDHPQPWVAVLHEHHPHSASRRLAPFEAGSHRFASLNELQDWLGVSAPVEAA